DVIDVVEIEAADGERFQIIDGGGFLNLFTERRVVGRENPRDECGEAAGVFLNAAYALEMIDAMAQLFTATEHHGGGGAQTEFVRGAMHIFPIVAGAFEARDLERTSSSRISAPPPGMDCRPASIRRRMVSSTLSSLTSAMQRISGAEKQCR